MRKLFLISLLLLVMCKSYDTQTLSKPEVKISLTNGCQSYKGKEWDSCIIKLLKEFQDIYNAPVVSNVLSEDRISEEVVRITTRYCVKTICFEETREEYNPSFIGIVKKNLLVFGGGIVTGSILFLKSGAILLF